MIKLLIYCCLSLVAGFLMEVVISPYNYFAIQIDSYVLETRPIIVFLALLVMYFGIKYLLIIVRMKGIKNYLQHRSQTKYKNLLYKACHHFINQKYSKSADQWNKLHRITREEVFATMASSVMHNQVEEDNSKTKKLLGKIISQLKN